MLMHKHLNAFVVPKREEPFSDPLLPEESNRAAKSILTTL
jgi:hypothetical protein